MRPPICIIRAVFVFEIARDRVRGREAITSLASSYLIMSPPTLGRHECSSCDYLRENSFSDFHFDSDSEPTSRLALSPSLEHTLVHDDDQTNSLRVK